MLDQCIVYDIEIIKGILGKGEQKIEGIEYCSGWHDHINMGISCIGVYDYAEDRYRVFCQDNFDEWFKLAGNRQIWVTFNGVGFDDKVLEALGLLPSIDPPPKKYDILQQLWAAHGLGPEFKFPSHVGFSLDATCSVNLGVTKTGHGAMAPIQWQRGEIGSVIDYCLHDVRMTKLLFDQITSTGEIISPKTRKLVQITKPFSEQETR